MERVKALTTEAVEKQFPEVMDALKDRYGIRWVKRCACGAVTFEGDRRISFGDTGKATYSVMPDNGSKVFSRISIPATFWEALKGCEDDYWNCNHCVNHWGLDLCACGSGEYVDECQENTAYCGQPESLLREVW